MTDPRFTKEPKNQVRQVAKRACYDHETVYRILDSQLVGNVGFVTDDAPFVIPMLFARYEDVLLFHGSTKSRLMRLLSSGEKVCVSVTQLDGLVLAKSLLHHSMNYRSVCAFGSGTEITDEAEKTEALKIITEKAIAGRWGDARGPSNQELKATCVVAVKIESASAKIRDEGPNDEAEDMKLPVWTGVLPTLSRAGTPVANELDEHEHPIPEYVHQWRREFDKRSDTQINRSIRPGKILTPSTTYEPRQIKALGLVEVNSWKLKQYAILAPNKTFREDVIAAAIDHIRGHLTWPETGSGYGFVTVHFGDFTWLLVDLWDDDILHHFLFRVSSSDPLAFEPAPTGYGACVWELEVIKHERDAWTASILSTPNQLSFDEYVGDVLSVEA